MSFLRLHRRRIGVVLAVVMFWAGGLPGLVAAAHGVQIAAPLCTPTGPAPAENSDTGGAFDHCRVCPLATIAAGVLRDGRNGLVLPAGRYVGNLPATTAAAIFPRAEMMPLKGRAPPVLT